MSSTPFRRRLPRAVVRRWLGRGALVVSLVVLPQVVVPSGYDFAAQAQASADRKPLEHRPDAKIDKVGVLRPGASKAPKDKAAPAARKTRDRLKKATWPKAGKATASVPVAKRTSVSVGGLGVKLARKSSAKAGAAEKVALSVHSQSAAKKAGVNGVLLTVAPTSEASDKLRVSLDYSSFSDVYGGNFGPRLHLVALPACALTTPQKKSCRIQRPVAGADNDAASQTVSGTVPARTTLLAAAAESSGGGSRELRRRQRLQRHLAVPDRNLGGRRQHG